MFCGGQEQRELRAETKLMADIESQKDLSRLLSRAVAHSLEELATSPKEAWFG